MERGLALVTGAAHGIGLAISARLSADGFTVVAVDEDGAELAKSEFPDGVHRIHASIAEKDLILSTVEEIGVPAAVLVNNVGVMAGKSYLEITDDEFANSITTNILDTWRLTRGFVDRLVDSAALERGVIFNLSLHADRIRMCPDYSASKAALRMLAQEMAFELGPMGIRVNSVWPGAIDTWSDRVVEAADHRRRSEAMVPLRRLGTPQDVAALVSFLCSPEASYLTGADIRVDGGLNQFNWLHNLYSSASDERSLYEQPE